MSQTCPQCKRVMARPEWHQCPHMVNDVGCPVTVPTGTIDTWGSQYCVAHGRYKMDRGVAQHHQFLRRGLMNGIFRRRDE